MSTAVASSEPRDLALTQWGLVAAVTAAFPITQLSGTLAKRYRTQHALKLVTPANAQITDEQGDLLGVYFLTASPFAYVLTQKGKARLEAEDAATGGY